MNFSAPRSAFHLCLLALFCWASSAGALLPHESQSFTDELLPQGPDAINRELGAGRGGLTADVELAVRRELGGLSRETGGRWRALAWNPVTLTPRLVAGSGVSLGETIDDDAAAERLARRFIDRAAALRGVTAAGLEVTRIAHGLGKWSVHFIQRAYDLPVIGSRFTVTMTETGRVAAFGGDLWPALHTTGHPRLSPDAAIRAAHEALQLRGLAPRQLAGGDYLTVEKLGWLPAGAGAAHPVYRISAFCTAPLGAWLLDVDAGDGRVHQVQNVLRTLDFSGTVTSDVENPGWCFGIDTLAVNLMAVTIAGVGADTTDITGAFTIPFSGSTPESLHAALIGPFFDVNNQNGPDAAVADLATPGAPYDLHWDEGNSRFDERDVFFHANLAHEFIKWIDPSWVDLDFCMPANVNIQSPCNAFYSGGTINFFHEFDNCANTGRLGDVVHHEYGHGITDYMYDPDPPSDVHEANSDVIGNYLTNESQIGRGFYLDDCENGIRDSNNNLIWPDDLTGQGHHDGQILAGFHWDARQNMMASLGEEAGHARAAQVWHFARALGLPYIQPEQVWWAFIADDDDGNLDSGTPNYDDLAPAALRHGFAVPPAFEDVVIYHGSPLFVETLGGEPILLTARIYSLEGELNPDSLLAFYRLAGEEEFAAALMSPSGTDSTYTAELPSYPANSRVEYYIFAADAAHNHLTDPRGAPQECHRSLVVSVYDSFEEPCGWTVGAPGDNATQGIWERVDPIETLMGPFVLQPEDDTTPDPGVLCWITGQLEGTAVGDCDADGQTTLLSPVFDLSSCDWAVLSVQRWFQTFGSAEGYLEIDLSNNGGPWVTIDHVEGFDSNREWELVTADLGDLFPSLGQIQLRAVMYGFPYPNSLDEGGIDDLLIMAGTGISGWPEAPAAEQSESELWLRAASSLSGGVLRITFRTPADGQAQVTVLDLTGRTMRTLLTGSLSAGRHACTWNGEDDLGRQLPSGVYFLRLATSRGVESRRILVAR